MTSPTQRPKPRRMVVAFGAMLLVAGLLGAVALFVPPLVSPSCGCASTPTHPEGWTPTPRPALAISRAEEIASAVAGHSIPSRYRDYSDLEGRAVVVVGDETTTVYVDGNTGVVLAAILLDDLLDRADAPASAATAQDAATEWLRAASLPELGSAPSVQSRSVAGLAYFAASNTGGAKGPEILLNSATGKVFGYRDLGATSMPLPVLSWNAAVRLAQSSPNAQGEIASPGGGPDFLMWDGSRWSWTVGFPDGVLEVDAVSGDVTVAKWASK